MKITKFSQLKDGMQASCVFIERKLNGVITIEGTFAYLCQNEIDGAECKDLKGYKYSVWIIDDTDLVARGVSDIKTIPTKKTKITKSRPEATSYMWDGICYQRNTIDGQDVKLLEVKLDELKIQVGRWHRLFGKKG